MCGIPPRACSGSGGRPGLRSPLESPCRGQRSSLALDHWQLAWTIHSRCFQFLSDGATPFELPSSGPHFALGRLAAAACRLAGCVANANDSTSDNNVILYDATTTTTTTTSTTTSTTTTTNDNKDNNNDNSDNSSWRRSLEHHMQSDMLARRPRAEAGLHGRTGAV